MIPETIELDQAQSIYQKMEANLLKVMRGQKQSIRWLLASYVSGGHVLLEDFPGTGKTTMAKALARTMSVDFSRLQFTPDMLPSDILGVSIYDQNQGAFHFHHGPIFTHILLADEVNRASPRTQSALLEAMAERQVTIEGKPYELDSIFFVIATQNPVEFQGTYPLPEAQMDRFALQFSLGYIERDEEIGLLADQEFVHPLDRLEPISTAEELLNLRQSAQHIAVSDEIKSYIVDLVAATRQAKGVKLGASPRASLSLMKVARACALFDGLDYLTPDIIQELAIPALSHRVIMDAQSAYSGLNSVRVIEELVKKVPLPL